MAHTRPGKRRDGPPGLPDGSICPFESSLGIAWQTVYQKFSHSNTLTSTKDTNRVPRALASMNVILQIIYIDLNVIHCTGLCFGMPSNL